MVLIKLMDNKQENNIMTKQSKINKYKSVFWMHNPRGILQFTLNIMLVILEWYREL